MRKTASACLDEDDVLGLVSGTLDVDRRQAALDHLGDCEGCRSLASTLARDDDVQLERTSEAAPPAGPDSPPPRPHPRHEAGEAAVDGRFRILGTLGRGAMGIVYRAHDESLGMEVALKILLEQGDDASGARAFARELKVGRRVTHPNVCRLYDAGQYEGAPYITMELLEGETLAELLARAGRTGESIGEERARQLLEGIAAGLAAVHAQGIVHRDLKPANVMVERSSGRPVLTDFGFATELRGDHSRRLVGTPSFWAPEQARGEAPTPASDVYSFGLLAYRLLARREYSLSDRSAMGRLPPGWRGFVERCLEPRPSNRFADAGEICAALRRRGRPRWPIAGAAAAILVIAFAAAVARRAPSPAPALGAATEVESARSAIATASPSVTVDVAEPPAGPARTANSLAPVPSTATSTYLPGAEKALPERPGRATGRRTVHPVGGVTFTTAIPSAAPSSVRRDDDPLYRH